MFAWDLRTASILPRGASPPAMATRWPRSAASSPSCRWRSPPPRRRAPCSRSRAATRWRSDRASRGLEAQPAPNAAPQHLPDQRPGLELGRARRRWRLGPARADAGQVARKLGDQPPREILDQPAAAELGEGALDLVVEDELHARLAALLEGK